MISRPVFICTIELVAQGGSPVHFFYIFSTEGIQFCLVRFCEVVDRQNKSDGRKEIMFVDPEFELVSNC